MVAPVVAPAKVSRRLLLARFGVGGAVMATFLLPAEAATKGRTAKPPPEAQRPLPVVVLDPGHGGKDPGAIGVSGTHEKRITLAAATELKRQLDSSGKYRTELTRTRDVFVPLEDRVARARGRGAALFVSIHADAIPDASVRGASVYTLAAAASDPQTASLAQRENSVDRLGGIAPRGTSPEVAQILTSLVRRETRQGSVRIARGLVRHLDHDLPMLPNPSRHASFIVLKAGDIPSVLVEMGFMSNARDEQALRKPEHRKLVASAMKRAIDSYFAAGMTGGAAAPSDAS